MSPEYCPISIGSAILAERWNILIIRELLAGHHTFNSIHRGLPGLSRTLLSSRLRSLQRSGLVEPLAPGEPGEPGRTGYALTRAGAELEQILDEIGRWAVRWHFPEPRPDQLRPHLLLWRIRNSLAHECLPGRRVVVEFIFDGEREERGWLILNGADSSACVSAPMFDVDIYARGLSSVWHEVYNGHRNLHDSLEDGKIELLGDASLLDEFPKWIQVGRFADYVASQR
ncbi:helix-turn-helix domain-containing protein [Pseudonocardia sp. C8]|uniref:winged helix-turn-helix transcriptional regulator n=1 Tax=Pseudonocardia sp. C8 TaxID=2762759 RepID=UPI002107FD4E|nr:helix-turn-helix domain-containing protein [Pseudonocardia sp. C8]